MSRQMLLPTASLKPDPNQPRRTRDPEKQRQLNESVALHGILQPLGVREDKSTLVWGEGRLLAARFANLEEVPAVVLDKELAESEYQNLALVENVVRSDLTPWELYQGCQRLLEANGWTLKELAKALSYDASAMTRIMAPSRCVPAVVEAFREGKIGVAHTYAISKAAGPEEQLAILNFALSGASRDAVEKEVKKKTKPAATVRVGKIKCPLPSGTVVEVKGEELSITDLIEVLTDLLKQVKKSSDEGCDIRALMALLSARAKEKKKGA